MVTKLNARQKVVKLDRLVVRKHNEVAKLANPYVSSF